MQQFLSYQTAMRVNDERDVREYITKRTCVSLIFSIGFFTLVIGFLLGKFVTTRQYRMKQLQEPDVITSIKQIPYIRNTAESATRHIADQNDLPIQWNSTVSNDFFRQYNLKLWNKLIWCGRTIEYNFKMELSEFVELLLDSEVNRMQGCLQELKVYLNEWT